MSGYWEVGGVGEWRRRGNGLVRDGPMARRGGGVGRKGGGVVFVLWGKGVGG